MEIPIQIVGDLLRHVNADVLSVHEEVISIVLGRLLKFYG